MENIPTI